MTRKDMTRRVRALVEGLTGTHIFRTLPAGIDVDHDLKRYLPHFRGEIVFDVGANIGQSAANYSRWFPSAQIFCFEPASHPFSVLSAGVGSQRNVRCFKLALSSKSGTGRLFLQGRDHAMSTLNATSETSVATAEDTEMTTLDEFCEREGIPRISFLKIDAEGHDLEVLLGADGLLRAMSVDLIQVEAGMNNNNLTHVSFERFKTHLEARGYFLFKIYEQVSERLTKEPHLRRANLVFCSREVIDKNRVSS